MTEPPPGELSERELEILKLLATGLSNKDIARQLVISPNTVKVHLRNIFTKTGAASRTEATLYAIRMGLVDHPAGGNGAGLDEAQNAAQALPAVISNPLEALWLSLGRYRWPAAAGLLVLIIGLASGLAWAVTHFIPQPTRPAPISQTGSTLAPRWQALAGLPEGRRGLGAAAYENSLYAIGGETAKGVTGALSRFDPTQNTWTSLAPLPHPVTDVQAAVLGETIYVPGGRQADGKPSVFLQAYDLRRSVWETRAALPAPRSAYALAAFEGKLYLFGGWDGQSVVDTAFEYDPALDRWRSLSRLPSARMYASAAALSTKLMLVGGTDGSKALDSVLAYYPERDGNGDVPWEVKASLPSGRYAMGLASLADNLYLVGGQGSQANQAGLSPLMYTQADDKWAPFDNPPRAEGEGLALTALQNKLYAIGGAAPGTIEGSYGVSASSGAPVGLVQAYQAIYTIMIPGVSH